MKTNSQFTDKQMILINKMLVEEEQKEKKLRKIVANEYKDLSNDQIETMDFSVIEKLAHSIKPVVNYF